SVTTTVVEPSDLAVTVHASKDSVHVGDGLTYTITVKNNGPGEADDVKVTDVLPSGIQFVSSDFTFTNSVADLGNMSSGTTTTFIFGAKATKGGSFTNPVSVTSAPARSHDSASVPTTVLPVNAEVGVSMTASTNTPYVGDTVTYTITLTNNGTLKADGV